ncbi:MAG: HlyD family efflux transporter periplasmic adaptor subunit [Bacteroidales bacterium]|nr:HlyD family efflux transporter periplasmic adaptor subunit [Bacteroidales bacterium]MCF8456625.1 HlyD family efflux transporter periplasmic adaptor subunit [Bacteroidales bacterium]
MEVEEKKIEIRSDDFQEIIGRTPSWMVRYGIIAITLSILVLLVGSYFFKYPDIIKSRIVITTENPPVSIIARADGKLQGLVVGDNEPVTPGQLLAFIETPANTRDIQRISQILSPFVNDKTALLDSISTINLDSSFRLGDIQVSFLNFKSAINDYNYFFELNYYPQKIESLEEEINQHKVQYNRVYRQRNLLEEEYKLSKNQFQRDSGLHLKGLISDVEFEKARSTIIKKKYDFEDVRTKLSDSKIRMSVLNQEILDLQLNFADNKKQLELRLIETFDKLLSEIATFEQKYILRSPIKGRISFNKIWSNNQFLRENETVFTIVPEEQTKIIGKLDLPVKNSGKVKPGQRVNIKLENYPYLEFGMVLGIVERISSVPENNYYTLEVSFPNGLTTNYNRELPFSQKMQGDAEIITENISLLKQIVNPLKSLIKKQTD